MTFHRTPKQFSNETERNIKLVVKAVHANTEAIASRFDGVDGYMERVAQELTDFVDEWAKDARATIKDALSSGQWDRKRFEGLGL